MGLRVSRLWACPFQSVWRCSPCPAPQAQYYLNQIDGFSLILFVLLHEWSLRNGGRKYSEEREGRHALWRLVVLWRHLLHLRCGSFYFLNTEWRIGEKNGSLILCGIGYALGVHSKWGEAIGSLYKLCSCGIGHYRHPQITITKQLLLREHRSGSRWVSYTFLTSFSFRT